MMPKSIALAIAFPLALGIGMLALYISWTVQPVIVGKIIFFGSILSIIILMPLLASAIQRFVRWTPNPSRDQILEICSMAFVKSVAIICGVFLAVVGFRAHQWILMLVGFQCILAMSWSLWSRIKKVIRSSE